MKTYPLEFRQKILECYYNVPLSQRQLAQRFQVSLSFVQKILKQYRETGEIKPKTHRCGRHFKLTQEQLISLSELIENNNDATLAELLELFREQTGIALSRATIGRMVLRLKMTRKKNSIPSTKGKSKSSKSQKRVLG